MREKRHIEIFFRIRFILKVGFIILVIVIRKFLGLKANKDKSERERIK